MKKILKVAIPIVLALAIILCSVWYLFIYDREFTRDMLLNCARLSEEQGNHKLATWFYTTAYAHADDDDSVAIELAEQYKASGNYTKAEYTLSNAIADGGGIDLYIALCKTYVQQDKLLDAVNMLNSITNPEVKEQLDAMRPTAPTASPDPGFYSQYISVTIEAEGGTLYATNDGTYPSIFDTPYADPITLGDGENTIYAVAVADNGLVSPLSIFGYTVGGVIELVKFADSAMEAAIRNALNVSAVKELYTNDLWDITSFTVPGDAQNYADLRLLSFLETLVIENGKKDQIQHLSSLSNLTSLKITGTPIATDEVKIIGALPLLKDLTLSNCAISNITALGNNTSLQTLDLSNNTIKNISAISEMKELTKLDLSHNALTEVNALAVVASLKELNISYNSISSISPLNSLISLTSLNASNNTITSLLDFSKLTNLDVLNLASNKLTDISKLSACTSVTDLNVSSNQLTDIAVVAQLENVMYFNFSHNQVKQLPDFKKDCQLVTIDGSHNQLSSLDKLGGLEHLNKVYMDYNQQVSSVKALAKCHALYEVSVYETKVTDVTPLTNQSVIVYFTPV